MKRITKNQGILLIIISVLFCSCAPVYVPNRVNVPLLSNAGEFQGSISYGLSGFDPQLALAITDNIGLMVNGSFANYTSDSTDEFHKHQFIEMGAGYYKVINNLTRFETFAGYGHGKIKAYDEFDMFEAYSDVKNNRYFIQPSIGITTKAFDGSFSSRFVLLDFYDSSHHYSKFFIEPVLTSKVGYKSIKGMLQFGLSVPLHEKIDFNYELFIFSIGIQVTLGKKYSNY